MSSGIKEIREQNTAFKGGLDRVQDRIETLNHCRRNNLTFHEIAKPDGSETYDGCKAKVRNFMREILQIGCDDIQLKLAHHLHIKRSPHPIIVKLACFEDIAFKGKTQTEELKFFCLRRLFISSSPVVSISLPPRSSTDTHATHNMVCVLLGFVHFTIYLF